MTGASIGARAAERLAGAVAAVLVLSLIAAAGFVDTPPVRAADPVTVLVIDGAPGDPISRGRSFVLYEADATEVSATTRMDENQVDLQFVVPGSDATGDEPWTLSFHSRNWWEKLTAGYYPGAVKDHVRDKPLLWIIGNGVVPWSGDPWTGTCVNIVNAEFTVHEVSMTWPDVHSFSASFRQACEETPDDPLFGEVHYNASGDFKAAQARPWTVDLGEVDNGTRTATSTVTVRSIGTQPVTLGTAQVVGTHASVFRIEADGCAGKTLAPGEQCAVTASARPTTNTPQRARLRIPDDTPKGSRESALVVRGLGEVAGSATISPTVFYPVKDDFKDEVMVSGTRSEPADVEIEVRAPGGSVVRSGSIPSSTGGFEWSWDGTDEGGALVPAGDYGVSVVLTDLDTNTLEVTETVSASHDYVTWQQKSVVRKGRAIWGWARSRNGSLSLRSRYPGGLRLDSGRGLVSVVYEFPVASSRSGIYSPLRFEVLGKSPNRRKAVIAIWNRTLGGFRDLSSYDAAVTIGPRYRWWRTEADLKTHRKRDKARAAVMTWHRLGGPGKAVFDIRRVRLTYRLGTIHRAEGTTGPSGLARLLRKRAPAGVRGALAVELYGSSMPTLRQDGLERERSALTPVLPPPLSAEPGVAEHGLDPGRDEPGAKRGQRPDRR